MKEISRKSTTFDKSWFFLTLLYLVVDYGRPQDILPIGFMRPAMIIVLILTFFILFSNKIRFSNSKQTLLIWCFVILTAIFVPFALNNYFAYHTTRSMLIYMPFILSTIIIVNSIERLKKLISVSIIVMVYVCFYSLSHKGQGSGSYLQDENDLSLYINTILPFCYFLLFYEKNKVKKISYAIAIAIGLTSVVFSFSRGGFLGLVCIAAIAWLFSSKKLTSLILICLSATVIYIYSGESYKKEMSTITNTQEGTARGRTLSWKAGWDMFLDNPLGVGGGNFSCRFPEYQSDEFKKGMWGRVAHSLWIDLIAELGIFGIIIYLALLYYNIKDIFLIKNMKTNGDQDLRYLYHLSCAFIASLAGFFTSATFLSVLYYPHYWYLTGILVAMRKIAGNIYIKRFNNPKNAYEKPTD
jgi:probable O-glycosylation ligase (exosortase A-associated)